MISIRDLQMTYRAGGTHHKAVAGVSLEVPQGAFFTLLGPSGCGKTTTLRCVAGLERPDSGEISVDGTVVYSSRSGVWVPPKERNIGMVFQSYAIWPHMTVFGNVAFPLRHKKPKPSRAEMRERVREALALVHLDGLEERPAPFLSGGQQQRLALARALVAEPRVLLLDEPLSNLDAKLREEMRLELRELAKRLNVTTLFVTHEQIEALTMSDFIAVMKDGVIVQQGSPTEIYGAPKAAFVAGFVGKTNFIGGRVASVSGNAAVIDTPIGALSVLVAGTVGAGDQVMVAVRPENIAFVDNAAIGAGNTVSGTVEATVYLGNMIECIVQAGSERVRIQIHPSAIPAIGAPVILHLPADRCLAMPA